MRYERKDIVDNSVIILITLDDNFGYDYISCRIYQEEIKKNFWGRLKNRMVLKYEDLVRLDEERSKWKCAEFELFANSTLNYYNQKITRNNNIASVKELIKKGCK